MKRLAVVFATSLGGIFCFAQAGAGSFSSVRDAEAKSVSGGAYCQVVLPHTCSPFASPPDGDERPQCKKRTSYFGQETPHRYGYKTDLNTKWFCTTDGSEIDGCGNVFKSEQCAIPPVEGG